MMIKAKIAIAVHIYYPELWDEISVYLSNINRPFDLFVTMTNENKLKITSAIQTHFPNAVIKTVANQGMDILPFLSLIPEFVEAKYQAVCKLHTKKGDAELGAIWRQKLLHSLIGSDKTLKLIISAFSSNHELAMVGTGAFYLSAQKARQTDNTVFLQQLYQPLNIVSPPDDWGFFAGSMFWVRPEILMPLSLVVNEYSNWFKTSSNSQQDGKIEHALERLIGLIPLQTKQLIGYLLPKTGSKQDYALHIVNNVLAQNKIGQAYINPLLQQYQTLEQDRRLLLRTGLFSHSDYLKQFPDLSGGIHADLPSHYLLIGRFQGATPHPDFDPIIYRQLHQQQLVNDEDCFLHYVHHGAVKNLLLRKTNEQQQTDIPSFRYRVLNTALINWSTEKYKQRDANKVSIIIPVFDQPKLTKACIESLYQFTQPLEHFEVVVVDNGSQAETQQLLQNFVKQYTNLMVLRNEENLNFALGCNLGFAASMGQQIIFLNNDTQVTANWLEPLLEPLAREDISAVQPRLLYPDGTVQCIGIVFSDKSALGYPIYQGMKSEEPWISKSRKFQAVTGACMALRASDFIQIRGFDPIYVNGQEDIDLCLRLSRVDNICQYQCWYSAKSIVIHKESQSENRLSYTNNNRRIFVKRWKDRYEANDSINYMEDGFLSYDWECKENGRKENLKIYRPKLNRAINGELKPLSGVEYDGAGKFQWVSLNNDPNFLFDFPKLSGCYLKIVVNIKSSRSEGMAKLYLDVGKGFTEKNIILFPYKNNETVCRIVYLETVVNQIRFDPEEYPFHFSTRVFSIYKIPERVAWREIYKKIGSCDLKYNYLDKDKAFEKYQKLFDQSENNDKFDLYTDWINNVESACSISKESARKIYSSWDFLPVVSIIIPTFNTKREFLINCINSIINQSYPYWELCIADDCSTKAHVKKVIKNYQQKNPNIKVCFRKENGNIAEASNTALQLATGNYIALMDHDDQLAEHALFSIVKAINSHSSAQIIYSDEDKIDSVGKRFAPHFKSDWNPDLFYSQNYISHLTVYKSSLISKVGGFRTGVEGSQDQDLLLRCLLHVKYEQIIHIPEILYHWRASEGSTALAAGEKSYTTDAGVKSLKDYFNIVNPKVKVFKGKLANTYRISWPIPNPKPLVSLLIPTRDYKKLTETCVRSILSKTNYTNYEILILDNGSVEPITLKFFKQIESEDERVRVLRYDYPFNYSAINNFGFKHSNGQIIGLVNNDIEVISPEWLTEMVSHVYRPDIGCVGAKLYYSNDTIQHAGVILGIGGVAGHSHKHFRRDDYGYFSRLKLVQNLSAVTAACLLVKRSIFEEVRGLDEDNLKIAFNDVDFCLKVQEAGYRNLWTPYAELYHHESISRGHEDSPEKIARFNKEIEFMIEKWGDKLNNDPFYNPNLTKNKEDFSIFTGS